MIQLLLEKTEVSLSQPLSAPTHFIYRVFTECINPCDDGGKCTNTKKIIPLLEYQYTQIPNYVQENFCGKLRRRNVRTNRFNEVILPSKEPFNSYNRGSHRRVLHVILQGVLNFLYILLV